MLRQKVVIFCMKEYWSICLFSHVLVHEFRDGLNDYEVLQGVGSLYDIRMAFIYVFWDMMIWLIDNDDVIEFNIYDVVLMIELEMICKLIRLSYDYLANDILLIPKKFIIFLLVTTNFLLLLKILLSKLKLYKGEFWITKYTNFNLRTFKYLLIFKDELELLCTISM